MARRVPSLCVALALSGPLCARAEGRTLAFDMRRWQTVAQDSGPTNYYSVVDDAAVGTYIHSDYKPPYETMTRGYQVPESMRRTFHKISWKWRALVLPNGGNECARGKGDSAAVVYLTWKRGLKWYALKYVWSAVGPKGAFCDRKSNLFRAQETVVLQSGGPLNTWMTESLDLDAEFRRHFGNGDAHAEVPDFMGVGLMSDGDQTRSPSSADFAGFVLSD